MMSNGKLVPPKDGNDMERKEILLYALQREDSLVNNRLTWVLTIQGFLFAAVALSIENTEKSEYFVEVIGFMGIGISCMAAFLSVWTNRVIGDLKTQWGNMNDVVQDVSPFGAGPHKPNSITNLFGLSFFLPIATGIAWAVVVCRY